MNHNSYEMVFWGMIALGAAVAACLLFLAAVFA